MKTISKLLILMGAATFIINRHRARARRRTFARACLQISESNEKWTGWQVQELVGGFSRYVACDEYTSCFFNREQAAGLVKDVSHDECCAHPLTSNWQLTPEGRAAYNRLEAR